MVHEKSLLTGVACQQTFLLISYKYTIPFQLKSNFRFDVSLLCRFMLSGKIKKIYQSSAIYTI